MLSSQYIKMQEDSVDLNDRTEYILHEATKILLNSGGEFICEEEIKLRICYKNKMTESISILLISKEFEINSTKQTELYLFNRINNCVSHVLCRNKRTEEDFDVVYFKIFNSQIINEVDNNFLTIMETTQLLNFRQIYVIKYKIIKIGDITFKIGVIYKDIFSKFLFLEIHNPFNSKYSEIKEFSYDVMASLFNISNLHNFCAFDSTLDKLNKEDKLKTNNHWEILQYVHLIFKK